MREHTYAHACFHARSYSQHSHTHTGHTETFGVRNINNLPLMQKKNVMMLCDGCGHGYHLGCLRTDLPNSCSVPQTKKWFCPDCSLPCKKCKKRDRFDAALDRLVQCDTCSDSWHISCLHHPLKEEPTSTWNCPSCESDRRVTREMARQRACPGCHGHVNNNDKTTCECSVCLRYWHLHSPCVKDSQLPSEDSRKKWCCPQCQGVRDSVL